MEIDSENSEASDGIKSEGESKPVEEEKSENQIKVNKGKNDCLVVECVMWK